MESRTITSIAPDLMRASAISRACDDQDVMIEGVNTTHEKKGDMLITLTLMLNSTQQLQKILRTLRNVEGVTHVFRARS